MVSQLQVCFLTKQEQYAVPNTPFSVPENVTRNELNSLISSLLKENGHGEADNLEFDFLVIGELLRLTLQQHLQSKEVSSEKVIEIEYFIKYPAPSPEDSLVHDDWVSGVQAAGNWILSGCYDNTLHIWGLDGEHKLTIPGHVAPVKSVSWINTGDLVSTFVSTSHDETAMVWQWNQDTNAVDCVHVCRGHARSVDCVSVNQEQNRFATGSYDNMLKIWSSDLQDENVEDSGGDDGNRKRLKTESGKSKNKTPLMTLSGHNEGISGVQWTDTAEICTSSMDNTLRIWDVELGGLKTQLNGSRAFFGISYSPLSRLLVSASADRHVRLWDSRSKDGSLVKAVFTSHTGWVTSIQWSPSDQYKFISGSHDKLIKLWDTRSPKAPLYDMRGHEDKVFAVNWSLENYILGGGADNHLKIFKFQMSLVQEETRILDGNMPIMDMVFVLVFIQEFITRCQQYGVIIS